MLYYQLPRSQNFLFLLRNKASRLVEAQRESDGLLYFILSFSYSLSFFSSSGRVQHGPMTNPLKLESGFKREQNSNICRNAMTPYRNPHSQGSSIPRGQPAHVVAQTTQNAVVVEHSGTVVPCNNPYSDNIGTILTTLLSQSKVWLWKPKYTHIMQTIILMRVFFLHANWNLTKRIFL